MGRQTTIELFKEEMKFSAGHFTIFSATHRENFHGHNFTVYVALTGEVVDNGMFADYGGLKRQVIDQCRAWNETFFLPANSRHLQVERDASGGVLARFNGEEMHFLARDVTVLPVDNVTIEELARVFGERLVGDGAELARQSIFQVKVKCSSGPGQFGSWEWTRG